MAWLNISKTAGDKSSPNARLTRLYPRWRDLLVRQLTLYDPRIVLPGHTHRWMAGELGILNKEPLVKRPTAWVFADGAGRLIVWAYHPSARIKDRDYVDDIVLGIREARRRLDEDPVCEGAGG